MTKLVEVFYRISAVTSKTDFTLEVLSIFSLIGLTISLFCARQGFQLLSPFVAG
jgi:hypothetical protein